MPASVSDLVTEAKGRILNLTADEFQAIRQGGALVVDVRESWEAQKTGSISGALLAPRGRIEFVCDPSHAEYNPDFGQLGSVLVYSGFGGRSALATDALRRMGYEHVAHLEGGLAAWVAAGYEVHNMGVE